MEVVKIVKGREGLRQHCLTDGWEDNEMQPAEIQFCCGYYGDPENIPWQEIEDWYFTVSSEDFDEIEESEIKSKGSVTMIAIVGRLGRWYPIKVETVHTDKGVFVTAEEWVEANS